MNKSAAEVGLFVHEEETTRVSFTIPQGVKTFQADLVGDEVNPTKQISVKKRSAAFPSIHWYTSETILAETRWKKQISVLKSFCNY